MYSVLIQNQKTMDMFHGYDPLFIDAIHSGKLGICRWLEAGTTVDTSVPELRALTDDKEEWRAIILRVEDESSMEGFITAPYNPYDFDVNACEECGVRENAVPLVRLTQILGGVPSPSVKFERELIQEEKKAPRVIYRPVEDLEGEAEYRRLKEKYSYDGKPPSEILLVSLRQKTDTRVEKVKQVWHGSSDSRSAAFWKRNQYPSNCRFLFFEMEQLGPIQRSADLFRLWISVMLLASNEIDPSTLQAYKLHRLSAVIDENAMRRAVQQTVNRLVSAKLCIEKGIQRELIEKISDEKRLPNYRLDVPVLFDMPTNAELSADKNEFSLAAGGTLRDLKAWDSMSDAAQRELQGAIRAVERVLDRSAEHMRIYCMYSDAEVHSLDKYQTEDLRTELNDIYHETLMLQSGLPRGASAYEKELIAAEKRVEDELHKRVTRRQALAGFAAAAVIFVLAAVPAAVLCYLQGYGSYVGVLITAAASIACFGLVELFTLLFQRGRLRKKILAFNRRINDTVVEISENAASFSKYLGHIASHIHGSTYLSILHRKKFRADSAQFVKQRHIAAIHLLINKLEGWSQAFHLEVHFVADEIDDNIYINTDLPPHINPLYTFESGMHYQVPVNATGDMVESPFGFVGRLRIEREELYDGEEHTR